MLSFFVHLCCLTGDVFPPWATKILCDELYMCCSFPPNRETGPCCTSCTQHCESYFDETKTRRLPTCLPRSLISRVFCVLYNPDPNPDLHLHLNPNHNPNPVPNSNLNGYINVTITLTKQGQRETGQEARRQSGSLFNPELNATAGFRCSTLPYRGWRFSRLSSRIKRSGGTNWDTN